MRFLIFILLLTVSGKAISQGNLIQYTENHQLLLNKIETKAKTFLHTPSFFYQPSQNSLIPELTGMKINYPGGYNNLAYDADEILSKYPEYIY